MICSSLAQRDLHFAQARFRSVRHGARLVRRIARLEARMFHDRWAAACRRLTRASSFDAAVDCPIWLFYPPLAVHQRLRVSSLLGLCLGITGCILEEPESNESTGGAEMTSTPSGNMSSAAKQAGSNQGERTQDPGIPGGTGTEANPGEPGKPGDPGRPGDPSKPGDPERGSENPESEPEPECKPGEVFEGCHELPNGQPIEFPTGVPLGACKAGSKACVSGTWGPCEGAVVPALEDRCDVPGDDSDCDGVPNSGCDCVNGQTRPCGESDVGECKMGTQACVNGKWSEACDGVVLPTKERCDGKGKDEDCDGKADIEDTECVCIDDTKEHCQRGGKKGDCRWGEKTCIEGRWGRCAEWAKPEPEVCGTRPAVKGVRWTGDEDCDGGIDTSGFGKPGPRGCVRMMLDQDSDGYGRVGKDLSRMREGEDLINLATACLCEERPDMDKRIREGWVREVPSRARLDCGDCAPGYEGEKVFPGSQHSATRPNPCLRGVGWKLSGGREGTFDLNCDRTHTDPYDDGSVGVLACQPNHNQKTCSYGGPGRLIPQRFDPATRRSGTGIWCGGSFEVGKCVPHIVTEEVRVDENGDPVVPVPGEDGEPVFPTREVLKHCKMQPTGRQHLVRCQ